MKRTTVRGLWTTARRARSLSPCGAAHRWLPRWWNPTTPSCFTTDAVIVFALQVQFNLQSSNGDLYLWFMMNILFPHRFKVLHRFTWLGPGMQSMRCVHSLLEHTDVTIMYAARWAYSWSALAMGPPRPLQYQGGVAESPCCWDCPVVQHSFDSTSKIFQEILQHGSGVYHRCSRCHVDHRSLHSCLPGSLIAKVYTLVACLTMEKLRTMRRFTIFAAGTWTLNVQLTPTWTGWSPRSFPRWPLLRD